MSDFAGSKRPASTPSASPSKVASKRSRTRYDYGDEDDTYSSAEDQWSAEDADSLSWDSEIEDIRSFMPSPPADFMSISSDDDEEKGHGGHAPKNLLVSQVSQSTVSITCRMHKLKLARSPPILLMRRQQEAQGVDAMTPMLLNSCVSTVCVVH